MVDYIYTCKDFETLASVIHFGSRFGSAQRACADRRSVQTTRSCAICHKMCSDTRQWHHRFASLYHKAVPVHLLERLQEEAEAIAQCDNFWISRVRCYLDSVFWRGPEPSIFWLQADLESRSTTSTAEAAIIYLLDGILHDKLPSAWAGAEWWVQVSLRASLEFACCL